MNSRSWTGAIFVLLFWSAAARAESLDGAIKFLTDGGQFEEVSRYFIPSFELGSDTLPEAANLSLAIHTLRAGSDLCAVTAGQVDATWYGGPGMTPEKNMALNTALAIARANEGATRFGRGVMPLATVLRSHEIGPEYRGVWIIILRRIDPYADLRAAVKSLEDRVAALEESDKAQNDSIAVHRAEIDSLKRRPEAYWNVGPGWSDAWIGGWEFHTPVIEVRRHKGPYTAALYWGRAFYASGRQDDITSLTITREFGGLVKRWEDHFGLGLEVARFKEWASEKEGAGDYWMARGFGGGLSASYEVWIWQHACLTLRAGVGYADFEERVPVVTKSGEFYFKDAAVLSIHLF